MKIQYASDLHLEFAENNSFIEHGGIEPVGDVLALAASTAEHKVVVTHHCPTMRKEFNSYPGGSLNSAFQVDLDAFIEESGVDYWVYGHTHYAGGSGTKIGNTTLLCNQLGYVFHNEHLDFDGKACIEV